MKHPASTRETCRSLALLCSIVLLLNMISCDCLNPNIYDDRQYGNLHMQVSPTRLVGHIKTTKITITPGASQGAIDLTKYKIRINFTEEGGTSGAGSSIKLASGNISDMISGELLESLAHFSSTSTLQPHVTPLQITLTLVPDVGVTSMDVVIQLLGAHNQVLQTHTVNWIHEEPIEEVPQEQDSTQKPVEVVPQDQDSTQAPAEVVPQEQDSTQKPVEVVPQEQNSTQAPTEVVPQDQDSTQASTDGATQEQSLKKEQNFSAEALQVLFSAIKDVNMEKVKQLLAKGNIDLGAIGEFDKTPLELALFEVAAHQEESEQIVKMLLKHGADTNKSSKRLGEPAWHEVFVGYNTKATLMDLLQTGVDINAYGEYRRYTALHRAVDGARIGFVKILLGQGARLDILDKSGRTAIDIATYKAVDPNETPEKRAKYEKIRKILSGE